MPIVAPRLRGIATFPVAIFGRYKRSTTRTDEMQPARIISPGLVGCKRGLANSANTVKVSTGQRRRALAANGQATRYEHFSAAHDAERRLVLTGPRSAVRGTNAPTDRRAASWKRAGGATRRTHAAAALHRADHGARARARARPRVAPFGTDKHRCTFAEPRYSRSRYTSRLLSFPSVRTVKRKMNECIRHRLICSGSLRVLRQIVRSVRPF